jgi:hypothetical protein
MSNKFIEVARFFDPIDAHILRGLLEAEDIKVEIFDEYFSSLTPIDRTIIGGIKLLVLDSDIEKAEPIIEKFYENLKTEAKNVCPKCSSVYIRKDYITQFKMFLFSLFGALVGTGFQRHTPEYKICISCGYKW